MSENVTTSEPTTGELIEALRCDGVIKPCEGCFFAFQIENCSAMGCRTDDMFGLAADRLEAQERTIATMRGDNFDAISVTNVLAYLDTVMGLIHCADGIKDLIVSMQGTAEELTARAEQAELERDAAVVDMKSIVDAVREEYSDGTCCFACKYDFDTSCDEYGCCPGECPGFESNDCFEWRGLPQDGEGV